jgi:hypothetical protein
MKANSGETMIAYIILVGKPWKTVRWRTERKWGVIRRKLIRRVIRSEYGN